MLKKLMFNPNNLYYETLKSTIQNHEKRRLRRGEKIKKNKTQQGVI